MKGFGIFLMIFGAICLLINPLFGIILIVAGFIFFVSGKGEQEVKIKEKEKSNTDEKELFIARRTKVLMDNEGMSITDAKTQAEMEYILEKNK